MPIFCSSGPHPLAREDAHQIVFERQIETRRTGISLASRASAKLVVDAPRLVPLCSQNAQSARLQHLFVLALRIRLVHLKRAVPVLLRTSRTPDPAGRSASCPGRRGRNRTLRRITERACPRFARSCLVINSALPPSKMSVPRPAMLVAIVTMPMRPACAKSLLRAHATWRSAPRA